MPGKPLLSFNSSLKYDLLGEASPLLPCLKLLHSFRALTVSCGSSFLVGLLDHICLLYNSIKAVGFTVCAALHPCPYLAKSKGATREIPAVRERPAAEAVLPHLSSRWRPRTGLHQSSATRTTPTLIPGPQLEIQRAGAEPGCPLCLPVPQNPPHFSWFVGTRGSASLFLPASTVGLVAT